MPPRQAPVLGSTVETNAFGFSGLDLRRLATKKEAEYVEQFLERPKASEENVDAGGPGMEFPTARSVHRRLDLRADSPQ